MLSEWLELFKNSVSGHDFFIGNIMVLTSIAGYLHSYKCKSYVEQSALRRLLLQNDLMYFNVLLEPVLYFFVSPSQPAFTCLKAKTETRP